MRGDLILVTFGAGNIKAVFQAMDSPYVTSVDYCCDNNPEVVKLLMAKYFLETHV